MIFQELLLEPDVIDLDVVFDVLALVMEILFGSEALQMLFEHALHHFNGCWLLLI